MAGLDLLPEDIFTVFARLGFSKYEAEAYATLCACGRLKMGLLAKYSMVPHCKIYSVVERLERKGVVIVSRASKLMAESVPFRQVVASRINQYLRDAQTASDYVESIRNTETFKHMYHTRRIALRSNGRFPLPAQH